VVVALLGLAPGGCGRLGYDLLVGGAPDAATVADGARSDGAAPGAPDGAAPGASGDAADDRPPGVDGEPGAVIDAAPAHPAGADGGAGDAAGPAPGAGRDAGVLVCPTGCSCPSYERRIYALCREALPYGAAAQRCARAGGHLIWIDDAAENAWLRAAADRAGLGEVWLGGTDAAEEGVWRWGDGAAFWTGPRTGAPAGGRFASWAPGEPNDSNGGEDCALMWALGAWNDVLCEGYPVGYACEAP
jgi:hypothetical protein